MSIPDLIAHRRHSLEGTGIEIRATEYSGACYPLHKREKVGAEVQTSSLLQIKSGGSVSTYSRWCLFLIHTNASDGLVALMGRWPNTFFR